MKNILTAAMTAFLFLFASAGCDDKNSDATSEVASPVDTADAVSVDQESTVETDTVASGDVEETSDAAAQTEADVEETDLSLDSSEVPPGDAAETAEGDTD